MSSKPVLCRNDLVFFYKNEHFQSGY
jgi:hypothetical protein